jgi:mRNA-degrading endonuclease toxin of MazEF toxin-antitoxin module
VPSQYPRRGEIYFASVRTGPGERKVRPVLIISPDARNRWASDVLAIPISTKVRPAPEHVLLDRGEGGLPQSSVAKCEQVSSIDRSLLEGRPVGGPISEDRMRQVEDALLIALGIFHK